jgi:hypothetical protein
LLFPIADWCELYRLQGWNHVYIAQREISIVDLFDVDCYGVQTVARRIRRVTGHHILGDNVGETASTAEERRRLAYRMDPHEVLAWCGLGEENLVRGGIGKSPDAVRALLERNLLRVGDFVVRFDRDKGRVLKVSPFNTDSRPLL